MEKGLVRQKNGIDTEFGTAPPRYMSCRHPTDSRQDTSCRGSGRWRPRRPHSKPTQPHSIARPAGLKRKGHPWWSIQTAVNSLRMTRSVHVWHERERVCVCVHACRTNWISEGSMGVIMQSRKMAGIRPGTFHDPSRLSLPKFTPNPWVCSHQRISPSVTKRCQTMSQMRARSQKRFESVAIARVLEVVASVCSQFTFEYSRNGSIQGMDIPHGSPVSCTDPWLSAPSRHPGPNLF